MNPTVRSKMFLKGLMVAALEATLVGAASLPLAAGDWPQWRGPQRNGISDQTGLLVPWPEAGPDVVWRRPIGTGFSGVSVVGKRLYTLWAEDGTTFVVCLDTATGNQVWRFEAGPAVSNSRGDGPRSTVTVDGDRCYTITGQAVLHALSIREGTQLWTHDLVSELGGKVPIYGYSASPLVVDELVVLPGGGPGKALLAFHRKDGRLVWAARSDQTSYSSPILRPTTTGTQELVFLTGSDVVGTTPSGEVRWSHPWPVNYYLNVATPLIVGPDQLFISTSYNVGCAVLQLSENAEGKVEVAPVWQSGVMKNHFQDSVVAQGHLFGFDNAYLKCVDVATGQEKWRHRGLGKGSLILADDHLIILGERGKLALVGVSASAFSLLSQVQLVKGRCWTPPALAHGQLYVRTESELMSLQVTEGGV